MPLAKSAPPTKSPSAQKSTAASLSFRWTSATRRIAVLGSMKELGDFSAGFHAQLTEPLATAHVDHAILVGAEMVVLARELGKASAHSLGKGMSFAHCETPAEAIAALEEYGVNAGDAILVKGSNSVGLGALVSYFASRDA